MVGMGRMGQYCGQMDRNAAARWTGAAGQTICHAGKVYKGGQLLPGAFLAGMGMGGFGGGGAAAAGKAARGFFGKALSWGGRALGMFGRFLPVVGGVFMAVELLQGILD